MNLLSFVYFIALIGISLAAVPTQILVSIQNGTLEGTTMLTRRGRQIAAFKNIPYALPPIGHLRFAPPQPAAAWTGVRAATKDVPICMQGENEVFSINPDNHMSEDCLYLNVYAPKPRGRYGRAIGGNKRPVMVWIHGGGFFSGTSHSKLYGPEFLLDQDIVLVTMNYRVGAFGFLSTVDSAAYGNQGLKDQVQSLRWVQENIEFFGGDPDSVTIFGESAGAVCVHHLIMSPLTKGLFHRAISQSGTSLSPWGLYTRKTARSQAFRLGKELKCTSERSEELIRCLREKDPKEIVDVSQKWLANGIDLPPHYRPVVEPNHEGAFLIEDPIESLKGGRAADVPWLNGINSHEGALTVAPLFGLQGLPAVNLLDQSFTAFAPLLLLYAETCPVELHGNVASQIRNYYFETKRIDESTRFNLIDLNSDVHFVRGHAVSMKENLKTNKSPMYYYYFNYKSKWSWATLLGDSDRDYGVCHADDLQYLFPIRGIKAPSSYDEKDYEIVDVMTTMWANFAKTGKPTVDQTWTPVQSDDLEQFVIIDPANMAMAADLYTDRLQFFESLPCPVGLAPPSGRL